MNDEYNNNLSSNKFISKKGKKLMTVTIICTLIILFNTFTTSISPFSELKLEAILSNNEQLKFLLDLFGNLYIVINLFIVLVITLVSIIFIIIEKNKNYNIEIYKLYILNGILHILLGTVGLTPLIYSISTLYYSLKNKKYNVNNIMENLLIIFSLLIIVSNVFIVYALQTGLFNKTIEEKEELQENEEIVIEDKDNKHTVTTFNNIINDWNNNITENKSYKIKNVKLNNISASLYIDYTFELKDDKPISTITIKHGNDKLYTYTDESKYFNLSYLGLYDNFIIYGMSYCDSVENGICNKHLTYSQLLAFNNENDIELFDNTVTILNNSSAIIRNTSVFLEDENVYASPYNDFRVYDINIKNNNIYFYTIVEDYDSIFNEDYLIYDQNCDANFWIINTFDMQRTFKSSFTYNELYDAYELNNLIKQDSITYKDYCTNKNIINFN